MHQSDSYIIHSMKKILFIPFLFIVFVFTAHALLAQMQFGGGIEGRENGPETGINLRVEYPFELSKYSEIIFDAGIMGSFYPTDRLDVNRPQLTDDFEVLGQSYTVGAHLTGEYGGLTEHIHPFAGIGFGLESMNAKVNELNRNPLEEPDPLNKLEESKTYPYISTSAGVKVMALPLIKPFVEIRYQGNLGELDDIGNNTVTGLDIKSNRRIVFGFMLQLN